MGFVVLLIIILFFVGLIFLSIKISNLKHRATQHILKNTGISSSEINAGFTSSFEKKHLENFLKDYPNYTEDSIKELLKQYTIELFNRNTINEFSSQVNEKMQKDSKLEKMQSMEYRRTTINNYSKSKFYAIVVYADTKDEYNVFLNCSMLDADKVQLDKYQISKGSVIGF